MNAEVRLLVTEASTDLEQDLYKDWRALAQRQIPANLSRGQSGTHHPQVAQTHAPLWESLGKQGEAGDGGTQAERLGLSPMGSYAKTQEQWEQRGADSAQIRDRETARSSVWRPRRPSPLHMRRNAPWSHKARGPTPAAGEVSPHTGLCSGTQPC